MVKAGEIAEVDGETGAGAGKGPQESSSGLDVGENKKDSDKNVAELE